MTRRTEARGRHKGTDEEPPSSSRVLASSGTPLLALVVAWLTLCGSANYAQTAQEPLPRTESSSVESVLARAQSATLERHYAEAIRILRAALKQHPSDRDLQLELGRALLATGKDGEAEGLFREILKRERYDRAAQLELARTLAYRQRYDESDALYRSLLAANQADEAAAIGLTSNLIHEERRTEAAALANDALVHHPNSLRLLEYKDRIAAGVLGGEERALPSPANVFSAATDYVNDSAGNHSWRESERLAIRLKSGVTTEFHLEQQLLHSLDDPLETVATFSEVLGWRPFERLALTAEGGAIWFDEGYVDAIYQGSLATQLTSRWLAGGGFSQIPIVPDAEAAEHRLTAQGWEVFSIWAPARWQINVRASRRHYSDENVGARQSVEVLHQWSTPRTTYTAGYEFRHYGFSMDVAHGYFSPDSYQSYQIEVGGGFRTTRWNRVEVIGRAGAESITSGADFQPAWEITARNQLHLRHWDFNLEYSRFDMTQVSGAFTADASKFEFAYHF